MTADKKYPIDFTEYRKTFSLSLHYNRANNYLLVNRVKIHKFKAKNSELVATPFCLGDMFQEIIWKRLD